MNKRDLIIKISGTSGQGIISSGDILSYTAAKKGYYVTTDRTFPSEIRDNGKCYYTLKISEEKILTTAGDTDIQISLDEDTIYESLNKIKKNGILIYDSSLVKEFQEKRDDIISYGIPLKNLIKQLQNEYPKNMIALGIIVEILKNLNFKEQILKDIEFRYKYKEQKKIDINKKALNLGIKYAQEKIERKDNYNNIHFTSTGTKLIMSGNEAIGLGAIASGCRFFSGYPITPATEIMEFLAKELPKFDGKAIQCEDEIAAINYALGASYAGVKAMTATSGPGFSLMQESIGLASMAELPIVITNVQRCGPSTGVPTKTEQSDLFAAIYGTHGDCPKIVLAPTNVEDCFYQTITAFNLAEQYQVPVIILSDAALGLRLESIDLIDFDNLKIVNRIKPILKKGTVYNRYEVTKTGISPITSPGDMYGEHVITGLEHTKTNVPSCQHDIHKQMTEKRFKKLKTAKFPPTNIYGDNESSIAVFEAIDTAKGHKIKVQALSPQILYPLQTDLIKDFIKNKDIIMVVEANYNAQFKAIITEKCININKDIEILSLLKYDGTSFTPEEIFNKIKKIAILRKKKAV